MAGVLRHTIRHPGLRRMPIRDRRAPHKETTMKWLPLALALLTATPSHRRIYRWTDCWRFAFHVWKQAIHANGSRPRQDSFSFLVERYCKHHTSVARGARTNFRYGISSPNDPGVSAKRNALIVASNRIGKSSIWERIAKLRCLCVSAMERGCSSTSRQASPEERRKLR